MSLLTTLLCTDAVDKAWTDEARQASIASRQAHAASSKALLGTSGSKETRAAAHKEAASQHRTASSMHQRVARSAASPLDHSSHMRTAREHDRQALREGDKANRLLGK